MHAEQLPEDFAAQQNHMGALDDRQAEAGRDVPHRPEVHENWELSLRQRCS